KGRNVLPHSPPMPGSPLCRAISITTSHAWYATSKGVGGGADCASRACARTIATAVDALKRRTFMPLFASGEESGVYPRQRLRGLFPPARRRPRRKGGGARQSSLTPPCLASDACLSNSDFRKRVASS